MVIILLVKREMSSFQKQGTKFNNLNKNTLQVIPKPYLFSATFWHLENAEQHVCRFLAHPNVLLKGF